MQLKHIKLAIAVAYVVVVMVAGMAIGVRSPSGWTALIALAVLPAAALLQLWRDPSPSLSESIQRARR
jgi:hypothetical protein